MPDFSPWGAAAQSGMGGYGGGVGISGPAGGNTFTPPPSIAGMGIPMPGSLPGGGAAANFNPTQFQPNLGGAGPTGAGAFAPSGSGTAMGPGNPTQMMQQANQNQWGGQPGQGFSNMSGAPGINGGRFNPMGQPTGIGQGGMNPLMGFLLPFLMQRMGVGGAQGGAPRGPSPVPSMNGQLGSVGAPQMGGGMRPDNGWYGPGTPQMVPGGNMLYGPGGQPPMQTKSPFDMQNPVPIQGGPVGGMPPGMGAPPREPMIMGPTGTPKTQAPPPPAPPVAPGSDKASYYGGQPPMSPEAQMQQQAQQMALNQSLTNMGMNNPMGAQMANLLRQQLMGQLGY